MGGVVQRGPTEAAIHCTRFVNDQHAHASVGMAPGTRLSTPQKKPRAFSRNVRGHLSHCAQPDLELAKDVSVVSLAEVAPGLEIDVLTDETDAAVTQADLHAAIVVTAGGHVDVD